jgi:hypothetical protein
MVQQPIEHGRGQHRVAAIPHGHWKITTFVAGLLRTA